MPRKFRDGAVRAGTAGLNWAMCALCLASFAVSGVLFYRELGLESRIASLEARCLRVQDPSALRFESAAVFRPKRDISECNCPPGKSTSS